MNTPEALYKFTARKEQTTAKEFFIAWNISPAIIAERLRMVGFKSTGDQIKAMLQEEATLENDEYLLQIALAEFKRDINQTLKI